MNEKYRSPEETLTGVKQLMERYSSFISLSGLPGILADIYALPGVPATHYYLNSGWNTRVGVTPHLSWNMTNDFFYSFAL